MTGTYYFIEPLDVLFLRGNRLFGDPGSFGESLVPPWPSVAAGALRSALLAHKGYDPTRFARSEMGDDPELGTPDRPGSFTLTRFQLARRHRGGRTEPLFPMPADLVVGKRDDGALEMRRLSPRTRHPGLLSSSATELLAVLPEKERAKPVHGFWLTEAGWRRHLSGGRIDPGAHLLSGSGLWEIDTRVGVGLDPAQGKAEDGKLFSVQAVVLRKMEHSHGGSAPSYDAGFLTEVTGARLPETLMLRLGGDGRGALARRVTADRQEPDYAAIAKARRCRLILTSPGLFAGGWRPNGTAGGERELYFNLPGIEGRLVCAAVPRAEVVSGFDLAERRPKPAQRAAPAGSVYWLDELETNPEALRKLAERGLWSEQEENAVRRAEGFNRFTFAAY